MGITSGGSSGISHRLHRKTNPESHLQPVSFFLSFFSFLTGPIFCDRYMTQAHVPTGHRCGSLGDIPDPLKGDRVPLFSVGNSGSLPLNGRRPSSYFQFCLRTCGGLFLLSLCLSVWLSVLSVLIYQHLTDPGTMGQRQSSPTPLSLITDLFKEVKIHAHDLSVEIKRNKLITFCSTEWPTFHVGWPSEGTFDLGTVHRVQKSSSDRGSDTLAKFPIS